MQAGHVKYKNDPNIGLKFGLLSLLDRVPPKPGRGDRRYNCLCDCGKYKIATLSALKRGHVKSCGCYRKLVDENKIKKLIGRKFGMLTTISFIHVPYKKLRWTCKCDCGKYTEVFDGNLKRGNTKSCGCLHERRGSEHPNWKPEISLEDRLNKRGTVKNPKYEQWRIEVFSRDGYQCQISGKTGKLVAHHIEAWNSRPDLRFDLNNGITILESIHIEFHTKYGRGNNTRQQLEEFINEYCTKY